MNRLLVALLLVFSPCLLFAQAPETKIEVHFSPKGGCTEAIVKEIDAAKATILVQAYSFTSLPIATALVAAKDRGVKVRVILDRSNQSDRYTAARFLHNHGVEPLIDSLHKIAHNKVMVIDGQTVITGSFNFTKQAETSNAENLLVIRDKDLSTKYAENWQKHAEHSKAYEMREAK